MMAPAIRVENVGKRYHVARPGQRARYRTLRESVSDALGAPLRRWRERGARQASEEFWALKEVSFDVQPGQVVGIIGRNGAGKSTLLKILSRITKPTTGQVTLHGRVGSLLEVGTGFHPELTGRENIYLNGSILGMTRREIDARFDEIVAFAETERFLDTAVKRYSSGMYVRLAFAVAAHLEPEILLVDEVLAVGDASFQTKCLGKLRDISREGRTVLFVSHNLHALAKLTEQAVLIDRGRAIVQGPTRQVISSYLAGGSELQSQWKLDASPTHKQLAITAIRVCNAAGKSDACLDADRPLFIEIEFSVNAATRAQLAVRLNASDGTTIFTSALSDPKQERATSLVCGKFRAACQVPAHLLRPGFYHLHVAANNPAGAPFDLIEQALQFQVTKIGSLVNYDERLGIVVPCLEWTCGRME
jgi:lipopolysaccharide transport system ATP-binding protein